MNKKYIQIFIFILLTVLLSLFFLIILIHSISSLHSSSIKIQKRIPQSKKSFLQLNETFVTTINQFNEIWKTIETINVRTKTLYPLLNDISSSLSFDTSFLIVLLDSMKSLLDILNELRQTILSIYVKKDLINSIDIMIKQLEQIISSLSLLQTSVQSTINSFLPFISSIDSIVSDAQTLIGSFQPKNINSKP